MRDASDLKICAEAKKRQAVIVTKDRDYVTLVDRDQTLQLLLIRVGNKPTSELFEIIERLLRGDGQVEIR